MFALPLTWFATAVLFGALCCAPLPLRERITIFIALAAFTLAILRCKSPHLRAALAMTLVVSVFYASWRTHIDRQVTESRTMRFTGIVLDERAQPGGTTEYRAKLESGLTVSFSSQMQLDAGERVVVRGRLEPFDDARNPGEPNQRDIEREEGLDARIASAHVLDRSPAPASPETGIARAKAWALSQLRLRLGEPGAEIVAGELLGARGSLPPDLRREFQETGTVHVLVTAGLHVGLVAALVVMLCAQIGVARSVACAIAIVSAWAFAAVSGLHIPALRAATMVTIALAARGCGRASVSWNALAIAVIAVVLFDPADVTGASFWLSFCCVGAIFAIASELDVRLEERLPSARVREAIVLTLATQLGTWPITAAVFLSFTPYAVFGNIAVVPCVPLTMALGATQLAFAWCAPIAQAFANLNGWIVGWMIGVVRTVGDFPFSSLLMTPAPPWILGAYEASLVACVPLLRSGGATLAAALLICTTSLVLAPPGWDTHKLKITVLDVGQADAIVIETPAHHAILVDSGGRLERGAAGNDSQAEQIGERIVAPFLIREGIHALDAIIISHPHGDHVGGCAPVLRKIRVAEIADGGQTYGGHAYHDCLDTAAADHVPIVQPRAGMVWRTDDGVILTFIGPSLPFIGGKNAINDNSIAFILQYKAFRMLFTGDAGVAAEQRFLSEGIDLHADVLKVGHHGSAYSSSSEFITAVHPRYAIISVGRHNLFGHPAPSTIATLESVGAKVYRTDEDAAVSLQTNGNGYTSLVAIQEN